jgi:hypothetical protein
MHPGDGVSKAEDVLLHQLLSGTVVSRNPSATKSFPQCARKFSFLSFRRHKRGDKYITIELGITQ